MLGATPVCVGSLLGLSAQWTQNLIVLNMTTPNPPSAARYRVLFVCMGNICRSPTAHGVFEAMVAKAGLADRVQVDSAGTHNYHAGAPPDARSQAHALKRGYDLSNQSARQLMGQDFEDFDLVLVMDWDNLALAQARCPAEQQRKVRRLAEFFQHHDSPVVPDPYQGGTKGFEQVLDLVEDGCAGLLRQVQQQLDAAR
jgi:protein-tyrosine phosphatase